jgi:23S rRNA (guanosine2251-2'-O)-methyltransferase
MFSREVIVIVLLCAWQMMRVPALGTRSVLSQFRSARLIRLMGATAQEGHIHSRFWSQTLKYDARAIEAHLTKEEKLSMLIKEMQKDTSITKVFTGMAITSVPGDDHEGYVLPIHDGQIQKQHITATTMNAVRGNRDGIYIPVHLFSFNPRAQQIETSPAAEERPIDTERLAALNVQLANMNILVDDLMSGNLAGTPPAKIYRSFVCPRPGKQHLIEPIERAAKRTASQIELSLRQVRADQASYLRNLDKSSSGGGTASEDDDDDDGQGQQQQLQQQKAVRHPLVLLLDNVRSAFNVGSLFRTGETAGISEIVTAGITPYPPHPKLRKTAMQSLENVRTRHFESSIDAIKALKAEGYTICVMETTSKSECYTETSYPEKTVLVLGNEITGVDTRIMEEYADKIVAIPTYGVKNSLNVASAAPVVIFEVLRQWHAQK